MSKCTCGRTFRPPFCDSTHWLSEEEYQALKAKVSKLYEKKNVQTAIQSTDKDRLLESQDVSRPNGSSDNSTI